MTAAQGNKCWMCERVGVPASGSQFKCNDCDVVWFPVLTAASHLNKQIVFYGFVIDVMDFGVPGAPPCP